MAAQLVLLPGAGGNAHDDDDDVRCVRVSEDTQAGLLTLRQLAFAPGAQPPEHL